MATEIISGQLKSGGLGDRLMSLFNSDHPDSNMLRGAAFAFAIRVASAGLAFLSQALLARWIGSYQYGLFAYVYVWVIVLGTLSPLGMNSSILRFIPEYAEHKEHGKLRGLLLTGGLVSFGSGTFLAVAGAIGLYVFGDKVSHNYLVPFYLAFILLPMFSFTEYQEGVGRAWSWIDLALIPPYILRPVLLLAFMALAVGLGADADVKSAFLAAIGAAWCVIGVQYLLLRRRLSKVVEPAPRQFSISFWFKVSLPLLLVEGFSLLLMNTDIMMMSRYLPPENVGHYYAAVKTTGLIGFVYYAVVAVTAQRISALNASGDKLALEALVRRSAHWTFWPSLAGACGILSIGWPLLWMFGDDFTQAWPIMFILAAGLLMRAAVGPLDFVLNMMGQQNLCAGILGIGALVNIILNAVLIKHFGLYGAATATAASLTLISVMLLVAVDRRLGFHVLPWRRQAITSHKQHKTDENQIEVQDIDLSEGLSDIKGEWEDLMHRAAADNPVYGTDMILPALTHLSKETENLRALCLWGEDFNGSGRRLVGFFPYQNKKILPILGPTVMSAWHHKYSFCTLPLFDRNAASKTIAAWLDWIALSGRQVRLPLAADCQLISQIAAACAGKSMSYSNLDLYQRAIMCRDDKRRDYLSRGLSKQRKKTLAKQWRRLSQAGSLQFEQLETARSIDRWTTEFLQLEAKGWKGRENSAMSSEDSTQSFFQQVMEKAGCSGRLRFYKLSLDGAPVAMTMAFDWGGRLFFFKMAYDEQFRRYSPGMLLFAEITKTLESDQEVQMADSCAAPSHPLLNHMWQERRTVSNILIGGRRMSDRAVFVASLALINAQLRFTAVLKRVYHKLKLHFPR